MDDGPDAPAPDNPVEHDGPHRPWRLYPLVADALRARLRGGALLPGAPLPSEAALAEEFGVARNTLRRALAVLAAEGLVETHDGVGRFAGDPSATVALRPPRYRQIADDLRAQIADRRWRPGDRLPSESALCARYGVSRATVRRAFGVLTADGAVRGHRGKGHFVRDA